MYRFTTHFIETTDSTNRFLQAVADGKMSVISSLEDCTVLFTNEQTAGRGMGTNCWFSDYGQNILASFYFESGILARRQFEFNRFFALAVRHMVAKYLPQVQIKWPNDILVEGKKLAGILIEHSVKGDRLAYSIAGIGLNVNQITFEPVIPNPTSLKLCTQRDFSVKQLLSELIESCTIYYRMLKEGNFEKLEQEYLEHLYRLNEFAHYFYQNQHIMAKITGIDEYGRLCLVSEKGEELCCGFKEIKFE